MSAGIGGHTKPNRGAKDEWLTPPAIIEALGPFDLDPCAPIQRPWDTAMAHYTIEDDGLAQPWLPGSFVWCNPPYGPETWKWLHRLADHPAGGIALTFARTETAGFTDTVWKRATSLLFLEGRLHFHHVDGSRAEQNAGGPSVLIGYGPTAAERLEYAQSTGEIRGTWVPAWATMLDTPRLGVRWSPHGTGQDPEPRTEEAP